jgi:acetolactate synthase small subunit
MSGVDQQEFVTLTVYMSRDIAEVSRVLQALVRLPVQIERFNANLVDKDVSTVRGLEELVAPVMRLAVVATLDGPRQLERVTKSLNRLVSVYKVQAVVC